jgi:two-component system LytT family response regulator
MTQKIRTLVVDDEPIARARVLSLLKGEGDIELVGECATGTEAKTAIERGNLDLLFLDVQMPGLTGLELARTIQTGGVPAVVFITAYDQYALRAFEVHALDYLLKPFSVDRFRAALGHARDHLARRRSSGDNGAKRGGAGDTSSVERHRIMVKSGGRIHFIRTADIDWCDAAGNYVRMHVGAQEFLVRETMNHLESQLDARQFVRIHRSTIVNLDRIQEMQPSFSGEFLVRLRDGTRLTLSRGYRDAVQGLLGRPI